MNTLTIIPDPSDHLPPPWERQPGETTRAYGAFLSYRNLAPHERSLRAAQLRLYGEFSAAKLRQFQTWSAANAWVLRAQAWDDEKDRASREAQLKAVTEMRTRHAQIGKALQQKAVERLKEMDKLELTVQDVLAWILNGSKMERTALGEPETLETVEHEVKIVDFSQASNEDLRRLLARKLSTLALPSGDSED